MRINHWLFAALLVCFTLLSAFTFRSGVGWFASKRRAVRYEKAYCCMLAGVYQAIDYPMSDSATYWLDAAFKASRIVLGDTAWKQRIDRPVLAGAR